MGAKKDKPKREPWVQLALPCVPMTPPVLDDLGKTKRDH